MRVSGIALAVAAAGLAVAFPGVTRAAAQEGSPIPGAVGGRILDQETGRPVPGADISLEGTELRAVTNQRGEFRIEPVDPGMYLLVTEGIGYALRSDSLQIPDGALVEVTVVLSTQPVELEGMVVEVRSVVLDRQGFYEREEQGYGAVFIDRATILEKRPANVSDLFRNITGLKVVWGGIYGTRVFVNQRINFRDADLPGCEPGVWLDGIRSTLQYFDMMRVEEIEGIEVYTRGGAPGKFVNPCGTVAIWTRQRIH